MKKDNEHKRDKIEYELSDDELDQVSGGTSSSSSELEEKPTEEEQPMSDVLDFFKK